MSSEKNNTTSDMNHEILVGYQDKNHKNITEIKSSQFNWIDFHLPYITRNNPKVVLFFADSCHSLRNTSNEIFGGM